ncbi:hypothetical protein L596_010461 [Steinernema carpocapsae]|uniref:Uncharacterized protein n=1 Tax=Steinernema carpocapsae TaxID=34508 RepID=A0A4U5PIZ1_STECR|nr:hypothetical protein L596_010461 [Steinernema carpocapsae]
MLQTTSLLALLWAHFVQVSGAPKSTSSKNKELDYDPVKPYRMPVGAFNHMFLIVMVAVVAGLILLHLVPFITYFVMLTRPLSRKPTQEQLEAIEEDDDEFATKRGTPSRSLSKSSTPKRSRKTPKSKSPDRGSKTGTPSPKFPAFAFPKSVGRKQKRLHIRGQNRAGYRNADALGHPKRRRQQTRLRRQASPKQGPPQEQGPT